MDTEIQSNNQQANINDLPLEVLVEIFGYLPKNEYKNLALVNKSFYGAVCELEKFKYPLEINPHLLENPELYEGWLNSSRRFDSIIISDCINPDHLENLFALLDRHGSTIIKMNFESKTLVENSTKISLKLFMKVPHLQELSLSVANLTIDCIDGREILPELKVLTVDCLNSHFKTFFNFLRPNSIKKLTFKWHWNGLDEFMDRQLKVTDLSIHEANLTQSFNRHKLEKFEIHDVCFETNWTNMANLTNTHRQLKSFDAYQDSSPLTYAALPDNVIKALCRLPYLEKLNIVLDSSSDTTIDSSDFTQCSATEVFYHWDPKLSVNKILSMKNLQKLTIHGSPFSSIRALRQTPTLRYLELINCNEVFLDNILDSFEGLETLIISGETEFQPFDFEGDIHPQLKSLKIAKSALSFWPLCLILHLIPNLQILHSEVCVSSLDMEKITEMPSLKELEICVPILRIDKLLKTIAQLCNRVEKFKIFLQDVTDGEADTLKREFSQKYILHEATKNDCEGWMLRNH